MWGQLPTSLEVKGTTYRIRTDFRDIINILLAFNDPDLEKEEQVYICLFVLYEDYDNMPEEHYEAAFEAALAFIDNGIKEDDTGRQPPRIVDWEQDEQIMLPAINKVAGFDVRTKDYLHWWTFLGYYMEIGEGLFAEIVNIRSKKAKGKKLEKHEQEFYKNNKALCNLTPKRSAEEQQAHDRLLALLDN